MSTRTVASELNAHFSTTRRLQRCFREFDVTTVTTPVQDLHMQDHLRAAPPTELHNQVSETISGKLLGVLVLMSIPDLTAAHPHNVSEKKNTSVGAWHFREVFSSWMSMLCNEWPMVVVVVLWFAYGMVTVYVMDSKHKSTFCSELVDRTAGFSSGQYPTRLHSL